MVSIPTGLYDSTSTKAHLLLIHIGLLTAAGMHLVHARHHAWAVDPLHFALVVPQLFASSAVV